jgi:hypothetical protein
MTGMDVEQLIARHPMVFHTMSATAWPSVRQHGLLSTVQLIKLFGLDDAECDRLLGAPGQESTVLNAPGMPPAVIRDQKPMKFISEKIERAHRWLSTSQPSTPGSSSGPPPNDWTAYVTPKSTEPSTKSSFM